MINVVNGACVLGLEAQPVRVEVDVSHGGLPNIIMVGLPDAAVSEAKERVRAAIKNCQFDFPARKVVVNLAPADIRKEGTLLDLPLSLGILLASGYLQSMTWLANSYWVGEVSLDGSLRPVAGVLSIALMAKAHGGTHLIVPAENAAEASLVDGLQVIALKHLNELPAVLLNPSTYSPVVNREQLLQQARAMAASEDNTSQRIDFSHVAGHGIAKRALEIAAAGGHNVLLIGPPGSGKSMLSKAFQSILPPMTFDEMLEVSQIYSVAGQLPPKTSLIVSRPFRSPHHTASSAGLTGGGSNPKPGEITLAHRGVLFLDEFVEFPRQVLEVLRQPLEDGLITISRVQHTHTYPAKFTLLAAMNPCPCGYRGDTSKACTCSELLISRYMQKLSGPLLDRIDMTLEVPRIAQETLLNHGKSRTDESSKTVASRVAVARHRQLSRYQGLGIVCNGELPAAMLATYCDLHPQARQLLLSASEKWDLSARSMHRLLRLARTIADLSEGDDNSEEQISPRHLAEALQYRAVERLQPKTAPSAAYA